MDPLDRTPPDQEHLDPAAGDEEDSSEEEEEGGFGRFSGGGGGFVSDSITICELDIDSILQTYQMPLYFSHSNKFISPRGILVISYSDNTFTFDNSFFEPQFRGFQKFKNINLKLIM